MVVRSSLCAKSAAFSVLISMRAPSEMPESGQIINSVRRTKIDSLKIAVSAETAASIRRRKGNGKKEFTKRRAHAQTPCWSC